MVRDSRFAQRVRFCYCAIERSKINLFLGVNENKKIAGEDSP